MDVRPSIEKIAELQEQNDALEQQNRQQRAALNDAYSAIITLPTDALGWSYTDDKKRFSLRNDLLRKITKALRGE